MTRALKLENRGVIRLGGNDARSFLQGLITNDIEKLSADAPLYAAILTPQGKYLFDFILFEVADGTILMDVDLADMPDLTRRLMMYKLRADVVIEDASSDLHVWAFDENTDHVPSDPRHNSLGGRSVLADDPGLPAWPAEDYRENRIRLGVPNGHHDLKRDKYFWLECGAERLNGVDFHKGCYVGQEQTARMKHRSTLKKGIIPVSFTKPRPGEDSDVLNGAGKSVGTLHSVGEAHALAYVRFEKMDDELSAGGVKVEPVQDT